MTVAEIKKYIDIEILRFADYERTQEIMVSILKQIKSMLDELEENENDN